MCVDWFVVVHYVYAIFMQLGRLLYLYVILIYLHVVSHFKVEMKWMIIDLKWFKAIRFVMLNMLIIFDNYYVRNNNIPGVIIQME